MVLLLLVGGASGLVLERSLRSWLEARVDRELARNARAVAAVVEATAARGAVPGPVEAAVGGAGGERVVFVPADRLASNDDADVTAAARGEVRHTRRYDETTGRAQRAVAVPVRGAGGRVLGVVRASAPLAGVDEAIGRLRRMMLGAALVGLSVAAFMSWFASTLFAASLRALADAAARLVDEPGGRRVPAGRASELANLADSVNALSARLQGALERLVGERDRLAVVLDALEDAVVIFDADRTLVRANQEASRMLDLQDLRPGMPAWHVFRSADLLECVQRVVEGGEGPITLSCELAPGRRVVARVAPLRQGGGVVVLRDVTLLAEMERARRDLVANVSHELRTPVAIIRSNAEALADGALDDRAMAERFVRAIARNTERLSDLLTDLLDLSKLEAGQAARRLAARPVDVRALLARVSERLASMAERRRQTIVCDGPAAGPAALADPSALDRVLSNLVENALRHGVDEGHVWLRAERAGDRVRIEVADDGPGVAPRHRRRIFERFYRVDDGRARATGGAGLGLAIVARLVAAMGGTIDVSDRPPRGARFVVTLPAAADPGEEA